MPYAFDVQPVSAKHQPKTGGAKVQAHILVDEHLLEAVVREEADSCLEGVSGDECADSGVEAGDAMSCVGGLGDGPQPGRL